MLTIRVSREERIFARSMSKSVARRFPGACRMDLYARLLILRLISLSLCALTFMTMDVGRLSIASSLTELCSSITSGLTRMGTRSQRITRSCGEVQVA